MKILILSRKRTLYTTRRLKEECRRARVDSTILDPLKCNLVIRKDRPMVLYNNRPVTGADVVIPRVGTFGTAYAIAVLRQFDLMGVACFNNHGPVARARNKLGCLQLLAKQGVPIPETLIARYPTNLRSLIRRIGGPPLILKLLRGSQGTGVIFSESSQSAESVLESIWSLGEDIFIQQFIEESRGTDRRLFVCRGRVVGAMQRVARPGEFRSNIHRGGLGYEIQPTRAELRVAAAATRALGLEVAGVDLLVSASGPLVIEVNASPGLEGIESCTEQNIARVIVEGAVRFASRRRKRAQA